MRLVNSSNVPVTLTRKSEVLCGLYLIVNLVNRKRYIGSTNNIRNRFYSHRTALRSGKHHNTLLQRAWTKYGEVNFEFRIFMLSSLNDRLSLESLFMDILRPAYNIAAVQGVRVSAFTENDHIRCMKNLSISHEKSRKPIRMIDSVTGETLQEFASIRAAGNFIGGKNSHNSICANLKGKNKLAYGYKWEYLL